MAQVKIKSIDKRFVTVDITWDDGLSKSNYVISNVPVESFEEAQKYLFDHISGIYVAERAAADAIIYANPTIDPKVLAAIGKTFDDTGAIIT